MTQAQIVEVATYLAQFAKTTGKPVEEAMPLIRTTCDFYDSTYEKEVLAHATLLV